MPWPLFTPGKDPVPIVQANIVYYIEINGILILLVYQEKYILFIYGTINFLRTF